MTEELFKPEDCDVTTRFSNYDRDGNPIKTAISLDKANRIFADFLSKGVVVGGVDTEAAPPRYWGPPDQALTHTGILVNVRPIEPEDSAESLLRELIERADMKTSLHYNPKFKLNNWVDRSRKLLGGKK